MTVKPFQQANQLLREGQLEAAVVVYRKAIDQNPQFYGAYQNLGETLGKLGHIDQAVEMYRKAIELKPSAGWLHQELGLLLEKLGKKEEAIASFAQAVELEPKLEEVQVRLKGWLESSIVHNSSIKTTPQLDPNHQYSNRLFLSPPSNLTRSRVLVISQRANRIFSSTIEKELHQYFLSQNYKVVFRSQVEDIDAASFGVAILLSHQMPFEVEIIKTLRNRGFSGSIVAWFWDNHHHPFKDVAVAQEANVCIPGHSFATEHLDSNSQILKPAIPLCTTQWTVEEAQKFFAKYGFQSRSNSLYGSFTRYPFAEKRNQLLEEIKRAIPDAQIILFEQQLDNIYFGLTSEDKFAQWSSYKSSICLPLEKDLSQRFFDALLCGQIPIVPGDILDLDQVVPPEIQSTLPVIHLKNYDIESVKEAHREAVARFDAEGIEGIKRRHQFVLNNHLFVHRIQAILSSLAPLNSNPGQVNLGFNPNLEMPDIVIGILTCEKNQHKQQAIRDTWLKEVIKHNIPYFFIIGRPSSRTYSEGDILYVNAFDSYEHLPQKIHKFFQFVYQSTYYNYAFKVDDDCYVSVDNLLKTNFKDYDYLGRVAGNPELDRQWHLGKCDDSKIGEYQGEFHGHWANGATGYFLSRKAMQKLIEYSNVEHTASELYEDKMIGDILREYGIKVETSSQYVTGAERKDKLTNYKLGFAPWCESLYPQKNNDVVVFHSDAAPDILYQIHQNYYSDHYQNRQFLREQNWQLGGLHNKVCLERMDDKPIEIKADDVLCFIVVRNESLRLPYLLSYYREKGIAKFFVVDNHSTDDTLSFLLDQPDVYTWHTTRSYSEARWGVDWLELLLKTYGVDQWCLLLDADELLYYPNCETKSIQQLCRELEQKNKEAFTAVLLDMYSDQPIKNAHYKQGQDFLEICPYFDQKFYHFKAYPAGPYHNQTGYWGGLRQRIFGNMDTIDEGKLYCLNKVPLIKYKKGVNLSEGFHWINGLSLAEETGCLLHFKYFSSFHDYAKQEIERKEHWNRASEYMQYAQRLDENKNLSFYDPQISVKLENSQQLVYLEILKASHNSSDGDGAQRIILDEGANPENHVKGTECLDAASVFEKGEVESNKKNWQQAEVYYRYATEIEPHNSWYLCCLGTALRQQNKLDEAITTYQNSIALESQNSWLYKCLAEALFAHQRWEEAAKAYQIALKIEPDNLWFCDRLAHTLFQLNHWSEAETACRKFISLYPYDVQLHLGLGRSLIKQKKYDEALTTYIDAVKLMPTEIELYGDLINILLRQGKRQEAYSWYEQKKLYLEVSQLRQSIKTNPNNFQAQKSLGDVLIELQKWDEAAIAYRYAINLCSTDANLYIKYTEALFKEDKKEEAITAYYQALSWGAARDYSLEQYLGVTLSSQSSKIQSVTYRNVKYLQSIRHQNVRLERMDQREIETLFSDVLCFIVVRNENLRLPYLLSYYRTQGVSKFFVVDNGSKDGTMDFLLQQPDVYLWHTTQSYAESRWGVDWVEVLLQNYGVNHWCILVDADEILYYPDCETKALPALCRELDREGKQAMSTVLLDMYSQSTIKNANYKQGQNFLEVCSYFDKKFYTNKALLSGPEKNTTAYFGGLRQRVFKGTTASFCLSKFPLIKYDFTTRLYEGFHWIGNVDISNQTGCLLHFKYFSTFHDYAQQEAKRGEHWNGASEYVQYVKKLEQNHNLSFYQPELSVKLLGSKQLVDLGIITKN